MARVADQDFELQGDALLRKVGVDLPDDLVVVIAQAGELPVEIVETSEVFRCRGIAFIDAQLSSEEAREDEFRPIVREARLG